MDELRLKQSMTCPECHGRPIVDAFATRLDPKCRMCGGIGTLSKEPCTCGRGIVWRFGRFYSCNEPECQKLAMDTYVKELNEDAKVVSRANAL